MPHIRIAGEPDVCICDLCGRGFLVLPPGGVDPWPLWYVVSMRNPNENVCGGALVMFSRSVAVKIADNYEKIGGEEWLRGKRQP